MGSSILGRAVIQAYKKALDSNSLSFSPSLLSATDVVVIIGEKISNIMILLAKRMSELLCDEQKCSHI